MCGRFYLDSNPEDLAHHYSLDDPVDFFTSYNITPSSIIPVIRQHENSRQLINCSWGLIPHWAKTTKYKPFNARAETIDQKPFFRYAFQHNRCLIPANGYYEWSGPQGHKQPFLIKLSKTDLFSFAGLWEHWQSANKIIETCTIITTIANEKIRPVHDRMPVILDPGQYDEWLINGSSEMLTPYTGAMIYYPVSRKVNSPVSEGRELIEPLTDK